MSSSKFLEQREHSWSSELKNPVIVSKDVCSPAKSKSQEFQKKPVQFLCFILAVTSVDEEASFAPVPPDFQDEKKNDWPQSPEKHLKKQQVL